MQSDGNLVLYNGSTPVWHTSTNGNNGAYLGIQGDCNLVIYHGGRPIWATYRVCRAANPGRIDTLAYMINTSGKAVQDTRSGYGQMQRTDYVASEKRLRYMKNPYDAQRWELYFHDDSRVWLYQDTTQPAGEGASGTTSYQIEPASGMWMSRNWAVGDVTSFRATIKHYNHLERPCNFKGVDGLWKDGRHKLRFAGAVNLGGNLGQRDVIIVDRYHDLVVDPYNPKAAERFWYAKDLGWVRWDHWHDRTVPGSNWDSNDINVIVSPGVFWNPARPNENTNLRRVDMNTLNNTNPGTAPSHCR